MTQETAIKLFDQHRVRTHWNSDEEKWYFSIVDIVQILTDQTDYQKARKYWNKLSERLRKEGSQVVTKCHRLKMIATDGKYYATDAADTESVLRIIQSIPSPKAEPFKQWLAKVGEDSLYRQQ